MSVLSWYYQRLKSMEFAEIPHRLIELIQRRTSKSAFRIRRDLKVEPDVIASTLPVLPLTIDGLAERVSPRERAQLENEATALCAGRIALLGTVWKPDHSTDWSFDPEADNHWPWHQYAYDIPRRHGKGVGDVKFVWELSRLQHLQVLALAAHVTGHAEARRICLEWLEGWIDDNPPYVGLGYACGIELACRVVSVLVVLTYVGAKNFDERLHVKLWRFFCVHGRFIARFPSLYSSANNHLIAESAALFLLGALAPQMPEASHWRELGWRRLVTEADRQILPDGAGAEQSSSYLASTLEWFLICRVTHAATASANHTDLDHALRRGATFLSSIADIAGNVPSFGDYDDGVVLRPALEESNYLNSIASSIAASLNDADVMHPAFGGDVRTHMYAASVITKGTCKLVSQTFSDGGYTVLRTQDHKSEIYLLFDHGPLGFASTAGHGHADGLSVWLHIDGEPILVDFGTYRYGADGGWRAWARSTAAHNTVQIDGVSQSVVSGPFNWGRRANSTLLDVSHDDTRMSCTAKHDGYMPRFGIVHRRRVSIHSGSVEITDTLQGSGRHDLLLSFHFAPGLDVSAGTDQKQFEIRCDDALIATFESEFGNLTAAIVRQHGSMQPGAGAVSPGYNMLLPSCSILVSGVTNIPATIQSRIAVSD